VAAGGVAASSGLSFSITRAGVEVERMAGDGRVVKGDQPREAPGDEAAEEAADAAAAGGAEAAPETREAPAEAPPRRQSATGRRSSAGKARGKPSSRARDARPQRGAGASPSAPKAAKEAAEQGASKRQEAAKGGALPAPVGKRGRKSKRKSRAAVSEKDLAARAAERASQARSIPDKSRKNPVAWLLAGVGWVYAVGALIAFTVVRGKVEERMLKDRNKLGTAAKEWEGKAEAEGDRVSRDKGEYARRLDEAVKKRERLAGEVAALEQEIVELEAKRVSLAGKMEQIQKTYAPKSDAASKVVDELAEAETKLRAMTAMKGKLWRKYNQDYAALYKEYAAKAKDPKPGPIAGFFASCAHTPFGPAAAFVSGEKYYQAGWTMRAKTMYGCILKDYPDSPYVPRAAERLRQLAAEEEFKRGPRPFHPYKRLTKPPE